MNPHADLEAAGFTVTTITAADLFSDAERYVLALAAADQLGYLAPSDEWTRLSQPLDDPEQHAAYELYRQGLLPAFEGLVPEPGPRRGRAPGPLPRGTCTHCGNEFALRITGTLGQHQRRTPQGYRVGRCPGVDQPPAIPGK